MMRKEEIKKKLDEIEDLEDNWNENGAHAFSEEIVRCVRHFLDVAPPPDCIAPTANESIQVEYEQIDGTYIEYEFFDDRIKVFNVINGIEFESEIITAYDLIDSLSSLKNIME